MDSGQEHMEGGREEFYMESISNPPGKGQAGILFRTRAARQYS